MAVPALDAEGRIAGVDLPQAKVPVAGFHDAVTFADLAARENFAADCRTAFLRCSYWLGAKEAPRCGLEALARAIFDRHVGDAAYDADRSGVEWWVQVRGRTGDQHEEPVANELGEALGFHWDRDEMMNDEQKINVHPQVASVTYLTSNGAPTMVLQQPSRPRDRVPVGDVAEIPVGYLSHPVAGKHICFDGRLLHGVPPELAAEASGVEGPAGYTRLTFLANVWLNHRPTSVDPLGEEVVAKLNPKCVFATSFANPAPIVEVRTEEEAPVQGFAFGGKGEEHELWIPAIPPYQGDCARIMFTEPAELVRAAPPKARPKSGGKKGRRGGRKR